VTLSSHAPLAGALRGHEVVTSVEGRRVTLTNLDKLFWPRLTKGDLLRYYLEVSTALLPHLRDRPMVMKRCPDGALGGCFFMKRAPRPRPSWIRVCTIAHSTGAIDYPLIRDLPSLMWVVNLGCVDLNPWYSRCPAFDRPDFLSFDLDPGRRASFAMVKETAFALRELLSGLGMPSFVKTTGSRGLHVYVPIVRGPSQREVWQLAKTLARQLSARHGRLMTTIYSTAKRPDNRVHVDYNQNAPGRTLASVYSVRPRPHAPVSAPVEWRELPRVEVEDFRLDNMPARLRQLGDLWAPLVSKKGRFDLRRLLKS
jgi:bifunctional non-homologous end joining protein LigD